MASVYARAAAHKTAVKPKLRAISTAPTEATTETLAFIAHAQGIALLRYRLKIPTPVGKNIPMAKPRGKMTRKAAP